MVWTPNKVDILLLLAVAMAVVAAVLTERFAFRPMRKADL